MLRFNLRHITLFTSQFMRINHDMVINDLSHTRKSAKFLFLPSSFSRDVRSAKMFKSPKPKGFTYAIQKFSFDFQVITTKSIPG
jgi:hypothetical protein